MLTKVIHHVGQIFIHVMRSTQKLYCYYGIGVSAITLGNELFNIVFHFFKVIVVYFLVGFRIHGIDAAQYIPTILQQHVNLVIIQ